MNSESDRRDFDRFPMEFVLQVAAQDRGGNKFNERTVSRDISGGGARFITQQAGRYFPGQLLEMTIYLPGTDEVKAHMRATATVIRIDPWSNSGSAEKTPEMAIAVKLDTPMHLERDDVRAQGR